MVWLYQMFAMSFFVMFLCCYAWKHFRRDCKRPCRPHWDWPLCCRHAREQKLQLFLYPWTLTSKGESLWGQVEFRIQYVAVCVYCISLTPTKVFHLILWWKYSFFYKGHLRFVADLFCLMLTLRSEFSLFGGFGFRLAWFYFCVFLVAQQSKERSYHLLFHFLFQRANLLLDSWQNLMLWVFV